MPGYGQRATESGCYVKLQYFADPDKDDAWLEKERVKMRHTPRDFRREILMDDTVHDGDPVWPEYQQRLHEFAGDPAKMLDADGDLFGGWDCGTSRMPAFVLAILTAKSRQLRFAFEVVPNRPMAMETFAPLVKIKLKSVLPGRWREVQHCGDATVTTKSGAVERTAADVARESGFNIRPVSNSVDAREKAVVWALTDWCDETGGKPRAIYSPVGCPILVDGNRGAYHTGTRSTGDETGPGMQVTEPVKDFYSHVNDAHQYVAVMVERKVRIGTKSRRVRRI